jgi:hypothetical protein
VIVSALHCPQVMWTHAQRTGIVEPALRPGGASEGQNECDVDVTPADEQPEYLPPTASDGAQFARQNHSVPEAWPRLGRMMEHPSGHIGFSCHMATCPFGACKGSDPSRVAEIGIRRSGRGRNPTRSSAG